MSFRLLWAISPSLFNTRAPFLWRNHFLPDHFHTLAGIAESDTFEKISQLSQLI
jgi:hypothetical protein